MAPGVGLYLDELFFDNYNKNQEKTLSLQEEKLNSKNNTKIDGDSKVIDMREIEADATKEEVQIVAEKDVQLPSEAFISSGQIEIEKEVEAIENCEEGMKRKEIEVTLCPHSSISDLPSIPFSATSDNTDNHDKNEAKKEAEVEVGTEVEVDNEPVSLLLLFFFGIVYILYIDYFKHNQFILMYKFLEFHLLYAHYRVSVK